MKPEVQKVPKNIFKGLWIIGSCLTLFFLIMNWIAGFNKELTAAESFDILSSVSLLSTSIVFLIILYKAWAAIQDGQTRISPLKAVGFIFIPIFNFYWIFRAVWGFAKEYNIYNRRHSHDLPALSENLFLVFTILLLASGFFERIFEFKSMVVSWNGVYLFYGFKVVTAMCDSVNRLADIPPGDRQTIETPATLASLNNEISCPGCSATVLPGNRFCGSCGMLQKEPISRQTVACLLCSECGYANISDANFCEMCGNKLSKPQKGFEEQQRKEEQKAPDSSDRTYSEKDNVGARHDNSDIA